MQRTTWRWALGILAAFGIGALVAELTASPAKGLRRDAGASTPAEKPARTTTTKGRAAVPHAPAPSPEAPSTDAPSPRSGSAADAPAAASTADAPTGPRLLEPVQWSTDLATAYETAREREQLVLLFAVPSADT